MIAFAEPKKTRMGTKAKLLILVLTILFVFIVCSITIALLFTVGPLGVDITEPNLEGKRIYSGVTGETFVNYTVGELNIILTCAHGGYNRIPQAATRKTGCLSIYGQCSYNIGNVCGYFAPDALKNDPCPVTETEEVFTQEVTIMVAELIGRDMENQRPHVIRVTVPRRKTDMDRPIEEGAQNTPLSIDAWNTFHRRVEKAKSGMGRGIIIDIHAQVQYDEITEFGYLIPSTALGSGNYDIRNSSISALAKDAGIKGNGLIAGNDSIGAMLEQEGFQAWPSPRMPSSGKTSYTDGGGYIIRRHGSLDGSSVDALLMALPQKYLLEAGSKGRIKMSRAIAKAIVTFYNKYYAKNTKD